MRYRITAPVKGVNSTVAGVRLVDGVGEVDGEQSPSALAYFRRHSYGVEEIPAESTTPNVGSMPAISAAEPPSRSATKDAWVTWVTSEAAGDKRLTLDEATTRKRDELAEHVLGPKEGADQ